MASVVTSLAFVFCIVLAVESRKLLTYQSGPSTIPSELNRVACGFSDVYGIIWILGGIADRDQLISFNVDQWDSADPFTLYPSVLPHDVIPATQTFAQGNDNILYVMGGSVIYSFLLSSGTFVNNSAVSNWIAPSTVMCFAANNDYLIGTNRQEMHVYDINTGQWITGNNGMVAERLYHGCAIVNGWYYSFAGYDWSIGGRTYMVEKIYVNDMENIAIYNWTQLTDGLFNNRSDPRGVTYNDRYIYVVGGWIPTPAGDWAYIQDFEVIDTTTDSITIFDSLDEGRAFSAVVVARNRLYVFGGDSGSGGVFGLDSWQYFDLPTASPTTVSPTTAAPTTSTITAVPTASPMLITSSPTSTYPTSSPTANPNATITTPTTQSDTAIQYKYFDFFVVVVSVLPFLW